MGLVGVGAVVVGKVVGAAMASKKMQDAVKEPDCSDPAERPAASEAVNLREEIKKAEATKRAAAHKQKLPGVAMQGSYKERRPKEEHRHQPD